MSRDEEQIKKNVLDEIDKIKEVLKDEKNFKDIFKECSIIDDLIIIYERILGKFNLYRVERNEYLCTRLRDIQNWADEYAETLLFRKANTLEEIHYKVRAIKYLISVKHYCL